MAFIAAVTFLTVLRPPWQPSAEALRGAPSFFPLVGALLGIALALVDQALRLALPVPVVSAVLLLLLFGATGGLHLDGLADTCDAFFATGVTPERRLEIMRDSHVGAYAIAGVALVLLAQYASLAALSPTMRGVVLLLTTTLSRWTMAMAIALFPYARTEGLGAAFRTGPSVWRILWPTAFVFVVALLVAGPAGPMILAAVGLTAWATARALLGRLPGLTGDTYGAIHEVAQTAVLVFAHAVWPA